MHPSLSGLHSQEVRRRQSETAVKYDLMRQRQSEDKQDEPSVHTEEQRQPKLKVGFLNFLFTQRVKS